MTTKVKRRPIAEGDKVWMLRDSPLEQGPPCVVEGVVRAIGRSHGKRIYNCTDTATKMRNILMDKDTIRPRTNRGLAELLRELANRLNVEAHRLRNISNSLLDRVGTICIQIADLEGGKRGH